jgi:hypothetical protein
MNKYYAVKYYQSENGKVCDFIGKAIYAETTSDAKNIAQKRKYIFDEILEKVGETDKEFYEQKHESN